MDIFFAVAIFAGGYAASIYTWSTIKGAFVSTQSRISSLEAEIASIKAKL